MTNLAAIDLASLNRRFWPKVQVGAPTECWPWQACLDPQGYGSIAIGGGRSIGAHRAAWLLTFGPQPAGSTLDHVCHSTDASCAGGTSCRHRRCVNPEHLEPVAQRVNTMRGRTTARKFADRDACANGHEFTPENTERRADGGRRCKRCKFLYFQRARARNVAEWPKLLGVPEYRVLGSVSQVPHDRGDLTT